MQRPTPHARRPLRLLAPWLLVGLVLVALAAVGGPAPAEAATVTTSHWVSFQDTFNGTNDDVLLAGNVHIVTRVIMDDAIASAINVHVNLADVTGVGSLSGVDYLLLGAASQQFLPEGLPILPSFVLGFTLMPVSAPPDPISPPDPITPLGLRINLSFDAGGTLTEAIVTIHFP